MAAQAEVVVSAVLSTAVLGAAVLATAVLHAALPAPLFWFLALLGAVFFAMFAFVHAFPLPRPFAAGWQHALLDRYPLTRLRTTVHMFRLVFGLTSSGSVDYSGVCELYETWQHHLFTKHTRYINMGFWERATDMDEATEAMASLLADTAPFRAGQTLLDCGFGFGDQDILWVQLYDLARIVGLNVTEFQVDVAKERARELGLADKLDFRVGSATNIEHHTRGELFDHVAALECAFHFCSRDDFFRGAYNALKPGGTLVVADCLVPTRPTLLESLLVRWYSRIAVASQDNLYDINEYKRRLLRAGFVDIEARDITKLVWRPLHAFMMRRFRDPEFKEQVPAILHITPLAWIFSTYYCWMSPFLDWPYWIVRARKPN